MSSSSSLCPPIYHSATSEPEYLYQNIISIVLIIFSWIWMFSGEYVGRHVLVKPYQSYPRLRIRPKSVTYIYILLIFQIDLVLLVEIIGLDQLPCALGFILYAIQALTLLICTSRQLTYFFRVKISQLKREKDPELYKQLKQTWLRKVSWVNGILYIVLPISILIGVILAEKETLFKNHCFGCDLIITGSEYVAKMFFFLLLGSLLVVLVPLYLVRDFPDVFAQFPEFRLQYIVGFPLTFFGNMLLAFDSELFGNLHTKHSIRAHWFICLGLLISFFIARPYQYYLASLEGELIDPDGVDILSRIWQGLKKNHDFIDESSTYPSLEQYLLLTKDAYQKFEEYLLSEYCVELIRFHDTVQTFQQSYEEWTPEQRYQCALEIKKKFLVPRSAWEINISDDMRTSCIQELTQGKTNKFVFQQIDQEVMKLLELGPYLRYQQTDEFKQCFLAVFKTTTSLKRRSKDSNLINKANDIVVNVM